jgi:hypothetical protein
MELFPYPRNVHLCDVISEFVFVSETFIEIRNREMILEDESDESMKVQSLCWPVA